MAVHWPEKTKDKIKGKIHAQKSERGAPTSVLVNYVRATRLLDSIQVGVDLVLRRPIEITALIRTYAITSGLHPSEYSLSARAMM
jgi:hypothetical protein